jgi:hypothetical protein
MSKNGKTSGYDILEKVRAGKTDITENQRIKLLNYLYEFNYSNLKSTTPRRKDKAVELVKSTCEELNIDSAGIETAPEKVINGIKFGAGLSDSKLPFNEVAYKNKWAKDNLDHLHLTVPKGTKDRIKKAALPDSVNSFILKAIEDKITKNPEE